TVDGRPAKGGFGLGDGAWRELYGARVKESFVDIYEHHAEWYDRLVSREDHPGALLPAVLRVCPLDGARIVEFGAGTGRVTRLIASRARRVHAFDRSLPMLYLASPPEPPNLTPPLAPQPPPPPPPARP